MSTEKRLPPIMHSADSHKIRASTFNSDWNQFIIHVSPGDTLQIGPNFFHVTSTYESTHAIPDSIVLGGHWFDGKNSHWYAKPSTYHCHKNRVHFVPITLSDEEIKKCGLEVGK